MSIQDSEAAHPVPHVTATTVMGPSESESVRNIAESSAATIVTHGGTQTTERSLADSNVALCGVCHDKESKYKCSRCYLPYCSIACSTIHKATHPATEPKPDTKPHSQPSNSKGAVPRPGTFAAAGFKGPFAVLEGSKELLELFKQFPKLPSQLDEIHTATLRPIEEFGQSRFRRGKEEQWNQDRGLQKGVQALHDARKAYGKDGEGVREFGRLVLLLLSKDEAMNTEQLLQKQIAEENAMIIQQLLDGEL